MQTDVSAPIVRTADFAVEAADFILGKIRAGLAGGGVFRLALSGGNTPRAIHAEMIRRAGDLPWNRVQFTFGDERCVPPDDAESNFRMARESLFDPLATPAGNIFRMRGEIDPENAAREYETQLGAFASRFSEVRYVHDLILLGMGPDGHTASLFPESPALEETSRNIVPVIGPKPPPQRLTMTFPMLNAARHVCFLINGADKLPLVESIVAGQSALPAARVRPTNGALTWIVGG
jgi:6-phosphogluconolactonase